MPELVEVEAYRRVAQDVVGRRISRVLTPDENYVRGVLNPAALRATLRGATVTGTGRIGKLLLLDVQLGSTVGGGSATLGLRFGMTGRLLVDGRAGVDELLYASTRDESAWDRFALRFADGAGQLVVRDPRRLGSVELNPEQAALGPDAATISLAELRVALGRSTTSLKARLLDQAKVAGVGNLAADELLWRAALAPSRPAGGLSAIEQRRLHRHLVATLRDLESRGGSHTGDLMVHRQPGGRCPKDGAALQRATVGGRTTWWCPQHQA